MAFDEVNDLESLRIVVEELGRRIAAPTDSLPTYNKSRDFAYPHIEHDSRGFHYVVVEKGKEQKRGTTQDVDELLYLIFQGVTFDMAMAYELKNRMEKRDCRRMLWQNQLELLGQLKDSWRAKRETDIQNILTKHPFDDLAGIRATLAGELRKQGFSSEAASEKAYEKYPLPAQN